MTANVPGNRAPLPASSSRGAVDLLEESVHLLRAAPLEVHAVWAIGALPFSLGLLWFTADMSWNSFANERLFESSFALALLYCWKQVWEAVFCARMQERVTGAVEPWSKGRVGRLIAVQMAVQPFAMLALPFAALLTVPFATVLSFFRNVSVYAGSGSVHAIRMAREQSTVETRQNWVLQSLLAILTLLLAMNYLVALLMLPQLGRSFFGIENTASRYPMWLFTSSGAMAVLVLVYLTLEPLLATLYVLRCFYGQSLHTGADIRASLRRILDGQQRAAGVGTMLASLAFALLLSPTPVARAQTAPAAPPDQQQSSEKAAPSVNAADLERSISTVMRRSEFAWRVPRSEASAAKDRPKWASWLDGMLARAGEFWDWLVEGLKRIFASDDSGGPRGESADAWTRTLTYSLWALGALFAVGAALILYQQRSARKRAEAEAAQAAAGTGVTPVDLNDESLTADKLPEQSWLDLAQEWIAKGDMRLALRAMHLAGLSFLNGRGLVTVQRWKTGLEYCTELERRSRSTPDVAPVFARNTRRFEASWYGRHEVNQGSIEEFARELDAMRNHANRAA